jgi:hypothetical protein
MKKCPKCNGECLEESKLCGICGYEFDKTELENISEENISMENNDNKRLDKNDINDGIYEVVEEGTKVDVIDDEGSNKNNKGNKNNKVIGGVAVGIIVAVLAIATTLIFGKNLFGKKAPEERLVDAYEKLVNANTIDMNSSFSFTNLEIKGMDSVDPQVALIGNIIQDFSFDLNTKVDREEFVLEGSYGVSMKNNKLLTADFYLDKELAGINIPFIYDKAFYIPWNNM